MTYPIVDPLLLRNSALILRTMAAMLDPGNVRKSGLHYAKELSLAAMRIETQPYTLSGGRDHD